jgi:hypothetical protein
LTTIGAPEWHGRSPDALNDSMVFGRINARPPPYDLVVANLHVLETAQHVDIMRGVLASGRENTKLKDPANF